MFFFTIMGRLHVTCITATKKFDDTHCNDFKILLQWL